MLPYFYKPPFLFPIPGSYVVSKLGVLCPLFNGMINRLMAELFVYVLLVLRHQHQNIYSHLYIGSLLFPRSWDWIPKGTHGRAPWREHLVSRGASTSAQALSYF